MWEEAFGACDVSKFVVTACFVLFLQMISSLNDLRAIAVHTAFQANKWVAEVSCLPQRLCSLPSSASRLGRFSRGEFQCGVVVKS